MQVSRRGPRARLQSSGGCVGGVILFVLRGLLILLVLRGLLAGRGELRESLVRLLRSVVLLVLLLRRLLLEQRQRSCSSGDSRWRAEDERARAHDRMRVPRERAHAQQRSGV